MILSHCKIPSQYLKGIFSIMKDLVSEANLVFTTDGITLNFVDPNKVYVLDLNIPNASGYSCTSDGVTVGINPNNIFKAIRNFNGGDVDIMVTSNDAYPNLHFEWKMKTLVFPSISIPGDILILPDLSNYQTVLTLPTKEFQDIVKDIYGFCDKVLIKTSNVTSEKPSFVLSCSSELKGQLKYDIDSFQWAYSNPSDDFEGVYLVKQMEKFMKILSKSTIIGLGKNLPLLLTQSIPFIGSITISIGDVVT